MMRDAICYSGAIKQVDKHSLGAPHYSYRFAEAKFVRCMADMSIDMHFVMMPEYYSSSRSYTTLPQYRGRYVHMIFRSTEQIRILKEAYNIVCFAWEFPVLKDKCGEDEHPFLNQKQMLSLCDEVWVPCTFTKRVLEEHGLTNVHCIPAPIEVYEANTLGKDEALRRLGHIDTKSFHVNFLGHWGRRRGDEYTPLFAAAVGPDQSLTGRKVYLAIFNPEDFRKNLDAMVRGFDAFQQHNRDAILIIKALTSPERFTLDLVVLDVMVNKLASGSSFANDNIIVFNQFLTDEEMSALYDLADFYLCTSIAEGQNLPLLEAMARGVVPVTTRTTAMLDYIDPSDAVIIGTNSVLNENPHLAGCVAGKPYNVDICDARQVTAALNEANALTEDAYNRLSSAARMMVHDRMSFNRLQPAIAERLRAIAPGRSQTQDEPAPPHASARSWFNVVSRRA